MGVQESEKAEVSSTDDLQASKQDGIGGRGRGRGRRDRDRLSREDSHESGKQSMPQVDLQLQNLVSCFLEDLSASSSVKQIKPLHAHQLH